MDYEKKYKDLIERLRNAKNDESVNDDRFCCVINELVPELAEVEDEKIRKDIVFYIAANHKDDGEKARWLYWLEKQEQKQELLTKEKALKNSPFVEQKPADKVEPKFHEGEWVVFNNKHESVYQVERIDNYRYYLRHYLGGTLSVHFDNELIRQWTIQDAKDGDVLYLQKDGKEHIIIYKGVIKERFRTFVSAYCAYNGIVDAFCFADVNRYIDIAYGGIMPASKEQRDQLEKAMTDAGYTFDFEKKELKKIEQTPVEWHKEDEQNLNACLGFIPDAYLCRWLKDIIHVKYDNPAWSEEDEKIKESIITGLEMLKDGASDKSLIALYNKKIEWLKSLKDRVQPKQEWSEEDEDAIAEAIIALEDMYDPDEPERCYAGYTLTFDKAAERLKSLRPQSHWRPSKEQMEARVYHIKED